MTRPATVSGAPLRLREPTAALALGERPSADSMIALRSSGVPKPVTPLTISVSLLVSWGPRFHGIDRSTPSRSARIRITNTRTALPTPHDLRHSKTGVDVRCLRPEDLQDRTHRRPRVAEAAEAALLDTGLRVSELCDPTSKNVLWRKHQLRFKGNSSPNLARTGHAQTLGGSERP